MGVLNIVPFAGCIRPQELPGKYQLKRVKFRCVKYKVLYVRVINIPFIYTYI